MRRTGGPVGVEQGYLSSWRAKSVTLTETGLEQTRALEARFLGNTAEGP